MKPFGSTSFRELCSLFISLWDERNKKENKNNTSFTNINSLYLIFVSIFDKHRRKASFQFLSDSLRNRPRVVWKT